VGRVKVLTQGAASRLEQKRKHQRREKYDTTAQQRRGPRGKESNYFQKGTDFQRLLENPGNAADCKKFSINDELDAKKKL